MHRPRVTRPWFSPRCPASTWAVGTYRLRLRGGPPAPASWLSGARNRSGGERRTWVPGTAERGGLPALPPKVTINWAEWSERPPQSPGVRPASPALCGRACSRRASTGDTGLPAPPAPSGCLLVVLRSGPSRFGAKAEKLPPVGISHSFRARGRGQPAVLLARDKRPTRGKLQANVPHEYRCKLLNGIAAGRSRQRVQQIDGQGDRVQEDKLVERLKMN